MVSLEEYKNKDKFNGIEVCKLISRYWQETNYWNDEKLDNRTYKEIWEYSSSGELFMVQIWWMEELKYYAPYLKSN